MITAQQIIEATKLHPYKIKNIYMFGSQVYGTQNEDSDYDFIVLGSSLLSKQEIHDGDLNIHIHTPDVFLEGLKNYEMNYLECVYAPDFAKLQENIILPDKNFSLKTDMLKYKGMAQSFNAFHKAKERINDGDDLWRGVKSLWHSIRILQFFIQIIEHKKIVDFSSANDLWKQILDDYDNDICDWAYYKEKYLPIKIKYEKQLND